MRALFWFFCAAAQVLAQEKSNSLEFRLTQEGYRLAEYTHFFKNGPVVDLYYFSDPEERSVWLGGGWQIQRFKNLTLIPLGYLQAGGHADQLSLAAAVWGFYETEKWTADLYLAYSTPLRGEAERFLSMDSLRVFRVVHRSWDVGLAVCGSYAERRLRINLGPAVRYRDKMGYWSFSVSGGRHLELRGIRVIDF